MSELVECCVHNLTGGTGGAIDRSDPELRVSFCLDRCGTCYDEPFLVIDGEVTTGQSYEEILSPAGDPE